MNAESQSLWMEQPLPPLATTGGRPDAAQVCVIGAGIAGVSIALRLAEAGRQVLLIDRDGLGAGETARTSAHLASALDDRYYRLEHWHGKDGAALAAQSHAAAVDLIEEWSRRYAIDCDFERIPGYLLPAPGADVQELEREYEAALRAGLDVTRLEAGLAALPAWGPVLRFAGQARFHPLKYLLGLYTAALAAGVRFMRAEAGDVEDGEQPRVLLADGGLIQAESVVVASNVPFHRRVALHTKQAAYRSYMLAGLIPAGRMPDALIWDTADPYRYLRLQPAGDGKDWLLIGGCDHKTGQAPARDPLEELREWAGEYCKELENIQYAWSGQIIEPVDGLAFIGRDPGARNVYVVSGDSGNGLTHATLAAPLITALIVDGEHPWAALYDPARKRLTGDWLEENANVALQYRDWLAAGDSNDVAALPPGQGAVIRHGLHRFALYRNEDGSLSALSARCPHLGCAVRWNALERSWDCPCHGSRFAAADGHVLNGPARSGLEPLAGERIDGVSSAA
ncbi:FAD-dependent oxidoreductase [Tahibacter harae]|uniref:FAD-dependent oxidoreductase n=1 Tax=Tahibacter harae TaxID=2963937 RepID=A0ABT1QS20_9GAMM|nr:FAD-dependent oxidoreductase [Tahibacter harae]MCQ4165074.1 FAD-dependent oxidoreductase [Tahibacter harae]